MLRSGGPTVRPVLVDRVVHRTITLVRVLIVYDGWANLRYRDVIGIIVGPILAMFVTHVFSAGLAKHVALERRVTGPEALELIRSESPFLLLAIPPLALLSLFALAGASLENAIRAIIWIEALSIGFWAGQAARRAGFRGSSLAICRARRFDRQRDRPCAPSVPSAREGRRGRRRGRQDDRRRTSWQTLSATGPSPFLTSAAGLSVFKVAGGTIRQPRSLRLAPEALLTMSRDRARR